MSIEKPNDLIWDRTCDLPASYGPYTNLASACPLSLLYGTALHISTSKYGYQNVIITQIPADTRGLKPADMEVCYWALLFMPLVIVHHLLNVFVQLANKRGFKQEKHYSNNRHDTL
jgi:hypothetical protein